MKNGAGSGCCPLFLGATRAKGLLKQSAFPGHNDQKWIPAPGMLRPIWFTKPAHRDLCLQGVVDEAAILTRDPRIMSPAL